MMLKYVLLAVLMCCFWGNATAQSVDSLSVVNQDSLLTIPKKDTAVASKIEKAPEFPGGEQALMTFISDHLIYPDKAFRKGIQGRVVVSFMVERDGSVSNIKVKQGVHKLLDEEAVRLISILPKWEPGWANGHPVRVTYSLPLNFKITTKKKR